MPRSTLLLLTAAAAGSPSFLLDVNSFPESAKTVWLAVVVTLGLAGFYYWARDRA